jgi:ankyrin repeat protein
MWCCAGWTSFGGVETTSRGVASRPYTEFDLDGVAMMLQAGAEVDGPNPVDQNMTVLHYAARNGSAEAVVFLLMMGANSSSINGDLWTPLHTAAYSGHVDVCATLVHRGGADLAARDNHGWTPIHWAAHGGHADVCR